MAMLYHWKRRNTEPSRNNCGKFQRAKDNRNWRGVLLDHRYGHSVALYGSMNLQQTATIQHGDVYHGFKEEPAEKQEIRKDKRGSGGNIKEILLKIILT